MEEEEEQQQQQKRIHQDACACAMDVAPNETPPNPPPLHKCVAESDKSIKRDGKKKMKAK